MSRHHPQPHPGFSAQGQNKSCPVGDFSSPLQSVNRRQGPELADCSAVGQHETKNKPWLQRVFAKDDCNLHCVRSVSECRCIPRTHTFTSRWISPLPCSHTHTQPPGLSQINAVHTQASANHVRSVVRSHTKATSAIYCNCIPATATQHCIKVSGCFHLQIYYALIGMLVHVGTNCTRGTDTYCALPCFSTL